MNSRLSWPAGPWRIGAPRSTRWIACSTAGRSYTSSRQDAGPGPCPSLAGSTRRPVRRRVRCARAGRRSPRRVRHGAAGSRRRIAAGLSRCPPAFEHSARVPAERSPDRSRRTVRRARVSRRTRLEPPWARNASSVGTSWYWVAAYVGVQAILTITIPRKNRRHSFSPKIASPQANWK